MKRFFRDNWIDNIGFIHNGCHMYQTAALCGTRGWFYESEFKESGDEKVFNRELMRLRTSLDAAVKQNAERIYCFLHYPPI
jgi:predicted phosphohydrolase